MEPGVSHLTEPSVNQCDPKFNGYGLQALLYERAGAGLPEEGIAAMIDMFPSTGMFYLILRGARHAVKEPLTEDNSDTYKNQ